jgi:predicted phage terminase large subunit-like protein
MSLNKLQPQPGPQTTFLSTSADIAIYGGSAGGGKSYALLLEPLRHLENERFRGVIFRKTMPQIRNEGGLWEESVKLYSLVQGEPLESKLKWNFESGMSMRFSYLEYDKDCKQWQGAQVPFFGFDEVTHFTEYQFTYMMSRLRSDSGVPGYIRATCNPEADTWVRRWIDWWIGPDGLPILSRSGKLRWFYRRGEEMNWATSRSELIEKFKGVKDIEKKVKSFTFIPAKLSDNQILMEMDPGYEANLEAQSRVERERLLEGNWDVRAQDGKYFDRGSVTEVDSFEPSRLRRVVRYWDRAATEPNEVNPNPDWTVGLKMGIDTEGRIILLGMERFRKGPFETRERILATREKDGKKVHQLIEQDPGAAGKTEAYSLRRAIAAGGYVCKNKPVTKDKLTRFMPFSAAAETPGEVVAVRNAFSQNTEMSLETFYKELEYFSGDGKTKDDIVDCCSGGHEEITTGPNLGSFTIGSITKTNEFKYI